jgi:hypothetical protein
VISNIVEPIIEFMDNNKNVGIMGCKLTLKNGQRQIGDAGYEPDIWTAFNYSFFLSKLFPHIFKGLFLNHDSKKTTYVDWVSGAALIARKALVENIGLINESFFMYAEDLEWGLRARKKGWLVAYVPSIEITHLLGGSNAIDKISTRWIESLCSLVKYRSNKLTYFLFCHIMRCGFLIRKIIYSTKIIFKVNGDVLYKIYFLDITIRKIKDLVKK